MFYLESCGLLINKHYHFRNRHYIADYLRMKYHESETIQEKKKYERIFILCIASHMTNMDAKEYLLSYVR
jgi:hypothetical protein